MTLNISAQLTTLTIGTQDWSAWIESIQIGYGEYEMGSGLKPCTGTINLVFPANYANIPSNPEYRFNPSQWKRGQLIQILDNTIALPCSGNAIKIIKPPQRPSREQNGIAKMILSVGCAIAYEYFPPEPNDNFSGITAGTPKTRGAIINSILSKLRISSAVVINEYPINYPLPKIDGNWLDFCGQLADSAGYYLRCNTNGVIIAEKILNAGSSGITYTIGTDESDWTAIGDVGEQPIEKLIITGVKKSLDTVNTNPIIVTESATFAAIAPDSGFTATNPFAITVSKRTTTTKTKTLNLAIITEEIVEPLAKIAPDSGFTKTNPFVLTISKNTISKTFFDNGFITKKEETISETFAKIAPDSGFTATNPFVLTISKKTIQSWVKIGNQKYKEIFTEYKTFSEIAPDSGFTKISPFVLALSTQKTTEGESSPPTDQPVSDFDLKEEQISSTVFASQLAPSDGRQRQRTIALPFASAVAQLTAYGQLFNKVLTGRAFGWRFATRLNTSLLPMQLITIVDGTKGYLFRMDALQWAMTLTEAHLVFNAIESGVFNTATPSDISYPVTITMGEFDIIGLSSSIGLFNPFKVDVAIGVSDASGFGTASLAGDIVIGLSSASGYVQFRGDIVIGLSSSSGYVQFTGDTVIGLSSSSGSIGVRWTPSAITTTQLWLDAADSSTITTVSDAVNQWNDKSGNSRNATQSTSTNRPLLTVSGLNGLNVISFDGVNDYFEVNLGAISQPYMVFFCGRANGNTAGGSMSAPFIFDSKVGESTRTFVTFNPNGTSADNGKLAAGVIPNIITTSEVNSYNAPTLIDVVFNGTSSSIYSEGSLVLSGTLAIGSLTKVILGQRQTLNLTVTALNGYFGEFIIITGTNSDVRQKTEGYLAHKWSLTANLPSDHPYKTTAPTV